MDGNRCNDRNGLDDTGPRYEACLDIGANAYPVGNIGNTWAGMLTLEHNSGTGIGSGFPNSGYGNRSFQFMIENTGGSGKCLGIATNTRDDCYSYSNTSTQASGWQMMGFYLPNRPGTAFNFTGQHSSMPCDAEYDDIMQSTTEAGRQYQTCRCAADDAPLRVV